MQRACKGCHPTPKTKKGAFPAPSPLRHLIPPIVRLSDHPLRLKPVDYDIGLGRAPSRSLDSCNRGGKLPRNNPRPDTLVKLFGNSVTLTLLSPKAQAFTSLFLTFIFDYSNPRNPLARVATPKGATHFFPIAHLTTTASGWGYTKKEGASFASPFTYPAYSGEIGPPIPVITGPGFR